MAEYTKANAAWADYPDVSTPVTASALNTIEAGIANAVAKDAVTVAGTRLVSTKLLSADTYPAFKAMGDGKLWWGAGGGSDVDTNLYREGGNSLATQDAFWAATGGAGQVGIGTSISGNPTIIFGTVGDTNLYRSAANTLKTDDVFAAGENIWAKHAAATQVVLGDALGTGNPAITFGSAADTNLYRSAADTLKTDDAFVAPVFFTQEGSGTVADNAATTQSVVLGSTSAFWLVMASMAGANNEVRVTWMVHTHGDLDVSFAELLRSDYNIGTISGATQDGGAQWSFNASSDYTFKITFTNQPTGGGTASWYWRATRIG